MIGQKLGRFRITSLLGRGGIATVWKARDELLGRDVALKILADELAHSPPARRRFLHEARAAAMLEHPAILSVYDTGEIDGRTYIALPVVAGETVSDLASRRLMPLGEAVRIARAAANALGHAHARGVIHRDVTGRNIMVAHDGRVTVLDFGLALAAGMTRITSAETTMGTAAYMAPEVAQGRGADARSDLYGLGVVLYEMLTGRFPFPGERPEVMIYSALHECPVAPREIRPDVPPALERVVLRAIARDPADRYQTAEEMQADLGALELDAEVAGTPPSAPRIETPVPGPRVRPDPLYLAVLPCEMLVSPGLPSADLEALATRLHVTLGAALSRGSGVRVVPAETSAGVPVEDRAQLARRLGANALLRGCVSATATQARVTWSVLDLNGGVQWAGDVVDGSVLLPYDLEDRVVASVQRGLGLAVEPLVRGATPRPHDPAAADRLAQALRLLARNDREESVDGAIGILEQLIESEGECAAFCAALARACLHKQRFTRENRWERRAAAACERAVRADPGAPEVLVALGDLHLATGSPAQARAEYERTLESQPGSVEALIGLSRALEAEGDVPGAEEACRRAIAAQPRDWRPYLRLARVLYDCGRYDESIAPCRVVIQLTPDNVNGWRMLGNALFQLDRLEEAAEAYREALAIQPSALSCNNLGTVLFFQGRYDESIPTFERATALTPADAMTWGNLGSACRFISGRESQAREALERAIALMRERLERNPADAIGWARLAGWLSNRGRHEDAIQAARHALDLAPSDVECMASAGGVYLQAGDRPLALRWVREAVRHGYSAGALRRSPSFAPLRDDPEFLRILEEATARAAR